MYNDMCVQVCVFLFFHIVLTKYLTRNNLRGEKFLGLVV